MKIDRQDLWKSCEYNPLVCMITSPVNFYQKYFVLPKLTNSQILKSRYYTRLKVTSYSRYIIASFPLIGTLPIAIYDFATRKRRDAVHIKELIKKNGIQEIQHASSILKNNVEFMNEVLDLAKPDIRPVLGSIGELLRNNPAFMQRLFDNHPDYQTDIIKITGDDLRDDKYTMESFAGKHPENVLAIIGKKLECDTKFMSFLATNTKLENFLVKLPSALKNNPSHLKGILRLKKDSPAALLSILEVAGTIPRNSQVFMSYALSLFVSDTSQRKGVLEKIGPELRKDQKFLEELALAEAMQIADDDVLNASKFMQDAYHKANLSDKSVVLRKIGNQLRNNANFMLFILNDKQRDNQDWVFENVGEDLFDDVVFRTALFEIYGMEKFLTKVGSRLKNGKKLTVDKEFIVWCLENIKDKKAVLNIIGDDLRNTPSFFELLLSKFPNQEKYVFDVLGKQLRKNEAYIKSLLKKNPNHRDNILNNIDDSLKTNEDFSGWLLERSSSAVLVRHQMVVPNQ